MKGVEITSVTKTAFLLANILSHFITRYTILHSTSPHGSNV